MSPSGTFDDSDEEWRDGAEHATGGYSDDDFDYEEYVDREFPRNATGPSAGNWKQWTWRIAVVVICLVLIWRFLLW